MVKFTESNPASDMTTVEKFHHWEPWRLIAMTVIACCTFFAGYGVCWYSQKPVESTPELDGIVLSEEAIVLVRAHRKNRDRFNAARSMDAHMATVEALAKKLMEAKNAQDRSVPDDGGANN